MSQINASGIVRVQSAPGQVTLNVFGTYATLDQEAWERLLDALEDAGDAAGFDL